MTEILLITVVALITFYWAFQAGRALSQRRWNDLFYSIGMMLIMHFSVSILQAIFFTLILIWTHRTVAKRESKD